MLKCIHYINSYTVESIIDPGVTVDTEMTFKLRIESFCAREKQLTATILRCFCSRDAHLVIKALNTYVRHILEYCSSARAPYLVEYVDKIEKVHRHFIEKLHDLKHKLYPERLKYLNIERLENIRIAADLVFNYDIYNNLINKDAIDYFFNSP